MSDGYLGSDYRQAIQIEKRFNFCQSLDIFTALYKLLSVSFLKWIVQQSFF